MCSPHVSEDSAFFLPTHGRTLAQLQSLKSPALIRQFLQRYHGVYKSLCISFHLLFPSFTRQYPANTHSPTHSCFLLLFFPLIELTVHKVCETALDQVHRQRRLLLNGNRKNNLVDWWLQEINARVWTFLNDW